MTSLGDLEPAEAQYLGKPIALPTGPKITVPYLGEVGTFLDARLDLLDIRSRKIGTLQHHVPINMRGPYKLTHFPGEHGEREGAAGYAVCISAIDPNDKRNNPSGEERLCRAKAINHSGKCGRHGGMIHPLDRVRIDWSDPTIPREVKWKFGKLPVSELDDEELSRGQIRRADGTWTNNPNVSIEVHDEMVRKLFSRADQRLREALLDTVETMADIATSTSVEPADRIRAASWIYERVRGKVPTEIKLTQDKPFEVVMGAVLEGGSRAASRAARGYVDELEDVVNAEVIELNDLEDDGSVTYEAVGVLDDPEARAEETASPLYVQEHVDPVEGPRVGQSEIPENPILRDQYEKKKLADRKEFQDQIKAARAKRFASRAKGLDHVESYPYTIEFVEDCPEDGPKATAIIWGEPKTPKMPREAEAKETRRRNRERWQ